MKDGAGDTVDSYPAVCLQINLEEEKLELVG